VRNPTVRNIGDQCIEEEGPAQWIEQRLFQLVDFEMLVAHTLTVDSDSLHGKNSLFFRQPAAIELVVRHRPEENDADADRQETREEKDDLPRFEKRAVLTRSYRDTVRHQAAEDLGESVEGEPDACARSLLFLGVPLGCEEGEAGRDGCFENAQEESDGHSSAIAVHGSEARQDDAPHDDIESRFFESV
jgi:hypothetical protein